MSNGANETDKNETMDFAINASCGQSFVGMAFSALRCHALIKFGTEN
jgi:hypothetical protein